MTTTFRPHQYHADVTEVLVDGTVVGSFRKAGQFDSSKGWLVYGTVRGSGSVARPTRKAAIESILSMAARRSA